MALYKPSYRLTVYQPASQDATESTALAPIAGAAHSDNFQVSTIRGLTGYQPYLGLIRGRRGRLDPLTKHTDIGELTIQVLDVKAGSPTDQLTRWMTAFLGDALQENRILGLKCKIEESTDNGATWADFFLGRIRGLRLVERLYYELTVREISADMQVPIFVAQPTTDVTASSSASGYAFLPSLLPLGLPRQWGSQTPLVKLTGQVALTTTVAVNGVSYSRALISLSYDQRGIGRGDAVVTDDLLLATGHQALDRVPASTALSSLAVEYMTSYAKVRVTTTSGAEGEVILGAVNTALDTAGFYHPTALYVEELHRENPADANPPRFISMPSTGAVLSFYVIADGPISDAWPLIVDDVHPVTFWRDILDGKFGYLWRYGEHSTQTLGTAKRKIAYSTLAFSTAAGGLAADLTFPTGRFIVTAKAQMDEWVEKNILQPWGLGYYVNGSGQVVPLDLRRPTALPTTTIADADLFDVQDALQWETTKDTQITRATVSYYQDFPVSFVGSQKVAALPNWPTGNSGLPKAQAWLQSQKQTLELLDLGRADAGDKEISFDAQGFRGGKNEGYGGLDRLTYMRNVLAHNLQDLQQPYGAGAQVVNLRCGRTTNTNTCQPGDLRLLSINGLPDPGTNLRGGTRIGRCVERSEEGLAINLQFVDLGTSVVASPPTLSPVAKSTGDPYHAAYVTVTLNASTEPAQVHYALSTAAAAPTTDSALWNYADLTISSRAVTAQNLPAGSRVWFRARTFPGNKNPLRLPSSWVSASSNGYADLSALAGPTALAAATSWLSAQAALLNWTVGDPNLRTEVRLATPSTDTLTAIATVMPGQTYYQLVGLAANSSYNAGVRHTDGLTGYSTEDTVIFSTLGGSTQAPAMRACSVLKGDSTGTGLTFVGGGWVY